MTSAAPLPDADRRNWVDRLAPAGLRPWLKLGRFDRPTGIWLLMLPGWQGVALADAMEHRLPNLGLMGQIAIGAALMRAAGCAYNDIVDRDIDAKVARTAGRPIIASASAIPCQPGSINSQIPTGRSNRPSFSQGRRDAGASRSTQFLGAASGRGAVVMGLL